MVKMILNSKTKTVTFAAFLLSGFAFLSHILGLARNNLLGNLFPKSQGDVYLAAFRLPDFVYGILITGGIVAAFLPVFSSYFKKSKEEAELLTNNVLTVFFIALTVISIILAIFAPYIIRFIVPGFSAEQKALTITLSRIMFLSPILLGMSAILSGILQYFDLFFAYALAPIFYNLSIIVGILFLAPIFGLKGLALGVVLGAFLHLIIQIPPVLKLGFLPHFSFSLKSPGLKKIFRLMIPRCLGSAAYHINLIVITAIASTLSVGAIRVFNFSNDLYGLPIGLLGVSFATAAFPALSRNFANNEKEKFFTTFTSVFSHILFLTVPLTSLLFLLRAQLVRLLYGTNILGPGYFDWWDTRLIAASLGVFTVSIFAGCLTPLLARAFFSFQDTKTPVKVSIGAVVLNIVLALLFVWLLQFPNIFRQGIVWVFKLKGIEDIAVVGLALALSFSCLFQFFLLTFSLRKKITKAHLIEGHSLFSPLYKPLARFLISSILMAFTVWLTLQVFADYLVNTKTVFGIFLQLMSAATVGILTYLLCAILLGSREPRHIWSSIVAQFRK